jgi:GNAT superfamily N-acetyltransferase
VLQGVLLSETEAWAQGMRVHPDYRGLGLSPRLSRAVFQWARDRGATVCRNMVFSWNVPGLGQSRSVGFAPGTEFRFARPEPDADAAPSLAVVSDAAAAWSFWTESAARDALGGVALDFDESWSVSQLRERDLERAADEGRLFVVQDGGTRGFTVRAMTDESEDDGETTRRAIYAVAAWDSTDAADALVDAVARDAAELGADEVRILVPEGVRWVSDLAAVRCRVSEEPDFVMRADLTDPAVTADFSHD